MLNHPASRAAHRFLNLSGLAALIAFAVPVHAQTLRETVESAWHRQPAQQAQASRLAELEGKRKAADALTPEPPALSISQRSDQVGSNLGLREWEVELSAPLWLGGQRERQRAVVTAEGDAYGAAQALSKWRLAGEVREAWWQARLADAERGLAKQRADSAAALAADVARRVRAGDLARVDANRAQAEQQAAQIALGEAEARAFRALQQFTALTGRPALPAEEEQPATQAAEIHPQRIAAHQQATLAQKRVDYAGATRRDPPELSLALTRERSSFEERFGNSIMLRLKLPFASDARNQPKLAAAAAERAEADANQILENARIDADIASARRELEQARSAVQLSGSRFELARDTQQLLDRAFKAGELDLPTRLRAEAERFEAERDLIRVRLEAGHATSKLNQALGLLP